MECPFCDEVVIKNQKVYETETEYVIHNIRPANKGQCVVFPKRHVENVRDLTEEEAASLFKTVKFVSGILKKELNPDAINYGFNEGGYAGQVVSHFHFHIMPRFKGDNLPEHHLFHRDPAIKKNLSIEELRSRVIELREIFDS